MPDLTPLLDADPAIQIHVLAALGALALTPVVLLRRRRDRWHRIAGYLWVTNMLTAALSSFAIVEIRLIGPFSPIHALSVFTVVNLVLAVRAARRGRIASHRRIMRQTAFWTLGVAGVLTLVPGRRMHAVVFGPEAPGGGSAAAALTVAVLLAAGLYALWRTTRGRRGARV